METGAKSRKQGATLMEKRKVRGVLGYGGDGK